MLRAHRSVVFSIVTALAGLPYGAGAMAGDASGAPQDAPPAPAQAEPAPPPAPPVEQPRKERFERRQERPRGDDPDRAQQMQQRQQERQDRLREKQEAERARAEREQQKQEAERARAEREQQREEAERARAEREQQKEEAERARAEREQQKQEAERARAEREQQKEEAERARAEREQQKEEAERARAEREQQKEEAERSRSERAVEERARQEQPQNPPPTDQQVRDRDTAPGQPRDDNRRRFERRENPSVATPPPARDVEPAVVPPPTREVDRAGPRDDNRRRFDRGNGAPRDVPPPSTYPAGGGQPAVAPPPVREEARRAVGRDVIRESYRRAARPQRSFDDLRRNRRERTISQGNLRVIEEPDRRVIVKQNNRTFIRHDESERFRRIAPDARTIRRADGTSTTFMTRSGGVRIYDVTDRNGRLIQRYRRYPNGREVNLIDNRRHYRREKSRTRDVLIGAGIGLVLGSAIALSAPEVRIPRNRYIVDYGRASDDDLYEALTAPPVERLDRGYSLEEIRYSRHLRDRMRRIDLDTVTFDFGSWEVGPDQGRALDRLADGINRVLQRNPDEIFMIEGHTDAVGSEEDNLTLSDRRAQSVAEILTVEYGVAPENLVTQGYGEEQLKIPTDGPERLNRRITVRRIGPLLTGQFDEERYSGARPIDNRTGDPGRGYEDLDDGPPGDGAPGDDGLPDVVPPDDGRTYDYDNDRYR